MPYRDFTRGFDFAVHLQPKDIPTLMACFKEGCYYDEDALREAIK